MFTKKRNHAERFARMVPGIAYDLRAIWDVGDVTFSNTDTLGPGEGVQDGSLTVVDTGAGTVKVKTNELEIVGSGTWGETGVYSTNGTTRSLGQAAFGKFRNVLASNSAALGWNEVADVDLGSAAGDRWVTFITTDNIKVGIAKDAAFEVGDAVDATNYQMLCVLGGYNSSGVPYKSGDTVGDFKYGVSFWIKGGTFTLWTLIWKDATQNAATLYGAFGAASATAYFDDLYIPTNALTPATMFQPRFLDTFTGTNGDSLVSTHEPDVVASVSSPGVTAWESGADTWDIQTNAARNTPTYDADIAPDNTCTTDAARTEANATTSWTNSGMATFESTAEGTEPNGTWSLHLVADGNSDRAYATITTVVGRPYTASIIYKKNAATDNSVVRIGNSNDGSENGSVTLSSTTWATSTFTFTALATTTYFTVREGGGNDDAEIWIDVLKVEPLTLNEMIASDDTGLDEGIFDIDGTIAAAADGQVGIVSHLDDKDTPANCVLAYYNRLIGKAQLFKLVGGTGTSLINTSATYAAGAQLRLIAYESGSDLKLRLYYNGALIGTEQTVSDAGIVDNTRHGIISVDSSNTVDNFAMHRRTNTDWGTEITVATGGKY